MWKAMHDYDPDQGVPFSAYAQMRVRGAMFDELRKSDPLTRAQRLALKQQAHEAYRTQWVSLEADERTEWIIDDHTISPEEAAVRADEIAELNRAIAKLTRQEQLVLALVFNEGLTLAETADVLELSRSRVSTIYHNAIKSLRGSLMRKRQNNKRR
ncbi:hypothetical protein GCM10010885_20890 [Alicyclobacillus cellulosilyticus]|uniref:RNA polymerase sigma factor (Sigma-70 family) n=1 Tax=Alicyclobacillus cellulosilyticus TaxID=1003997 RepID=A0A917NM85_9BACL|nr:hypothetical protein GCM10010885_20890 [Alicyclobacillus cellulosilyticus]